MLGHALGTAAGIRLANKVEEKEAKKKEAKARQKQENRENLNTATKLEALRRMRKDLKATVGDIVTRDYLDEELTKAFRYLNVDSSFYVSTLRAEIFEVGSWGKLAPNSEVDISKILQRVEDKKVRLAKYDTSNETVNNDTSKNDETVVVDSQVNTVIDIESLHEELRNSLTITQYVELTKLMNNDLGGI